MPTHPFSFGDFVSAQKIDYPAEALYHMGNFVCLTFGCCCIYSLFNVISIVIKQFLNWLIRLADFNCDPTKAAAVCCCCCRKPAQIIHQQRRKSSFSVAAFNKANGFPHQHSKMAHKPTHKASGASPHRLGGPHSRRRRLQLKIPGSLPAAGVSCLSAAAATQHDNNREDTNDSLSPFDDSDLSDGGERCGSDDMVSTCHLKGNKFSLAVLQKQLYETAHGRGPSGMIYVNPVGGMTATATGVASSSDSPKLDDSTFTPGHVGPLAIASHSLGDPV